MQCVDLTDWDIIYYDADSETPIFELKGIGTVEFILSLLIENSDLTGSAIPRGEICGPHTFHPGA